MISSLNGDANCLLSRIVCIIKKLFLQRNSFQELGLHRLLFLIPHKTRFLIQQSSQIHHKSSKIFTTVQIHPLITYEILTLRSSKDKLTPGTIRPFTNHQNSQHLTQTSTGRGTLHQIYKPIGSTRIRNCVALFGIRAPQLHKGTLEIRIFSTSNDRDELTTGNAIFEGATMCDHAGKEYHEGIEKSMILYQVPLEHFAVDLAAREFRCKFVLDDTVPLFACSQTQRLCEGSTCI
mmetsp:Transcript_27826/g.43182  ORF Transcript_27826/g.43182 Transcript_27826/m.43182 type:complete len:235 (+) Transcript_27826:129-833(+)